MFPNGAKSRSSDHEIVILLHLVQMVRVVRKLSDEVLAESLGVSLADVTQISAETFKPTLEQLCRLFKAVGMETEGVFEPSSEQSGKLALATDGFGNAIERGLVILNEEGQEDEEAAVRERGGRRSRRKGA
jgi:transcriptional regulator with XRE-family HTH domain